MNNEKWWNGIVDITVVAIMVYFETGIVTASSIWLMGMYLANPNIRKKINELREIQ